MVDLHCHILPGMDDGAETLEESLEMARIAVADGITAIVATPHTHDGYYRNDAHEVVEAVANFQQLLDKERIPLCVYPGAEVHVHVGFMDSISQVTALTVNNAKKYVLLELPVQSIPRFTDDLLYELKVVGVTPIIAHPERNVVLREEPSRLAAWVEQGAIAQLTADSLLGRMGERSQAVAEYMVHHRLVHVIASDAHKPDRRRPKLARAFQRLEEITSPEEARMFHINAHRVLNGEACRVLEPIMIQPVKKKRFFFF